MSLGIQYTYKYLGQSSGAYGTDVYGAQTYSCTDTDTVCQAGGPGAPNTGFFSPSNAPVYVGGFIGVALLATLIAYFVIRKLKNKKTNS